MDLEPPTTLLPLFLTGSFDWTVGAATALLPSLVGHLLYGAVTAAVFFTLEQLDSHRDRRCLFSYAIAVRRVRAGAVFVFGWGPATH